MLRSSIILPSASYWERDIDKWHLICSVGFSPSKANYFKNYKRFTIDGLKYNVWRPSLPLLLRSLNWMAMRYQLQPSTVTTLAPCVMCTCCKPFYYMVPIIIPRPPVTLNQPRHLTTRHWSIRLSYTQSCLCPTLCHHILVCHLVISSDNLPPDILPPTTYTISIIFYPYTAWFPSIHGKSLKARFRRSEWIS